MKDDLKLPIFNQTWELALLSMGKKILYNKWIYWIWRKMMALRGIKPA